MWLIARVGAALLVLLALRGRRWAYFAFIVVSLLYFPARVGFRLHPQACELAPTVRLLIFSLQNYPHLVIFFAFFGLSWVQFRRAGRAGFAWAGLATLLVGALVELAEGVTGRGHCRLRDLVPDAAGALLAALLLALWQLRSARRQRRSPLPRMAE